MSHASRRRNHRSGPSADHGTRHGDAGPSLVARSAVAVAVIASLSLAGWRRSVADDTLFTPGEGSVGAAATLQSPSRARDVGSAARQGWNDGGIIGLGDRPLGARSAAGGAGTGVTDALLGTEFEELELKEAVRREDGLPAGFTPPTRSAANQPATRRDGVSPVTRPPPRAAAPAEEPLPGDCGWLGMRCASRGVWLSIGGLTAAGLILAALIAREIYLGR